MDFTTLGVQGSELTVPICTNSDACTNALHAVKLDPAVLEAQISTDNGEDNCKPIAAAAYEVKPQLTKYSESCSAPEKVRTFEEMMKMQKAALLSLSPQQFDLLLKYCDILRMQRHLNQKHLECAFCKNNGEPASWYSLHMLKDSGGRVRCPVLRGYRCPGCGATGDKAHTIKYCPLTDRARWNR